MFILYAVVIGVLVGLLTGGRLGGLAAIEIRWPAAIAGGLIAQLLLFSATVSDRVGDLGPPLYVLSTLVVVAAVLRNRGITGMPIVILGAACNMAAIAANGGYMPASAGALQAALKVAPTSYSNSSLVPDPALWPLTDIFAMPAWIPLHNVFSVGDVLIGLGIAMVIVVAMRRRVPSSGLGEQATSLGAGGASGQ
jgi:hypothetical protein